MDLNTVDKNHKICYLNNKLNSVKTILNSEIEENDLLPWDWYYVCKNPNITFDFLKKMIKKGLRISWFNLCDNKFTYQKKIFKEQKLKEYRAVRKIEDFYLKAKYSPHNKLGKKFISKLYDNNFS